MPEKFFLSRCFSFPLLVADGKALVKLVDPAQLMKAREEKKALADAKAAKKAAAVEAAEREDIAW